MISVSVVDASLRSRVEDRGNPFYFSGSKIDRLRSLCFLFPTGLFRAAEQPVARFRHNSTRHLGLWAHSSPKDGTPLHPEKAAQRYEIAMQRHINSHVSRKKSVIRPRPLQYHAVCCYVVGFAHHKRQAHVPLLAILIFLSIARGCACGCHARCALEAMAGCWWYPDALTCHLLCGQFDTRLCIHPHMQHGLLFSVQSAEEVMCLILSRCPYLPFVLSFRFPSHVIRIVVHSLASNHACVANVFSPICLMNSRAPIPMIRSQCQTACLQSVQRRQ